LPSRIRPLQTGRADFPHPAYPNSLGRGHAQGSAAVRSQQAQTEVVHQVGIERPALGGTVRALTATLQMMTRSLGHVPVELV
jgi:hypothetical protein